MSRNTWRDVYDFKDGHQVKWIRAGADFFSVLIALINNAKINIHLQVYIVVPDETGRQVLDALKIAAGRGVQVNMVIDDFGADKFTEAEGEHLIAAGINFKRFEPILASGKVYVGRRMHHKIMLVDEAIAIVGGMNIANRYHGSEKDPPWLDYAVRVEGPVCQELALACKRIFERQFKPSRPKWPRIFTRGRYLDVNKVWVRIRKNDWLRNRGEITHSYNKSGRLADESITIVGGYFLPGRRYRRILSNAARRGVDVRIIMTQFSDVPVVRYATAYLYGWLMRNKIRIFESNKTMVHGKVVVVDKTFTSIGSYNQNHLSAYLSIELNLDIVNREFGTGFNNHLLKVITEECTEVTHESYYKRSSVFARLMRWSSYQVVRFSLRLLFAVNRIFTVDD